MLKTINRLTKERLAKGGPGSGRYPKGSSEQKEPASAKSGHHVEMDGKINSTGTSCATSASSGHNRLFLGL